MNSNDCIFCKIINGEIPSRKVYESDHVFAFLDISPVTAGHTLVVTKSHYYNLLDIDDSEIQPFFIDLKKIAALLKEKLNLEGFNIVQNNFPVAGQEVEHFHYHIIPRRSDGPKLEIRGNPEIATENALDEIYKKLQA